VTITPLQRRLLALLMLDPGARAGRLQVRLVEAGWNPKPTTNGITRSLTHLVAQLLVRRTPVTDVDPPTWRYSLTDKGLAETTRRPHHRKVA
jgi:hypothetical protein